MRSLRLVGGVLVEKRSLQLVLHIRVGREGKAFLMASFGIQLYKVAGYILDALLGAFLQSVPRSGAVGA